MSVFWLVAILHKKWWSVVVTVGLLSLASSPDPWTNVDGRLNAPAGTAQFPTMLNGYPTASPPGARVRWPTVGGTQPPWMVAGVDYPVGINRSLYPTNGSLSDPVPSGVLAAALTALGGSLSGTVITFSGHDNAVIQGWDFSLHGGYRVDIVSNGVTVQNCNFAIGTNLNQLLRVGYSATTNGVTIQYNVFDGGSGGNNNSPAGGLLTLGAYGTTLVQYNLIQNAWYELIQSSASATGTSTLNFNFNCVNNAGLGQGSGAHGDWCQTFSSTVGIPAYGGINWNYNFIFQNSVLSGAASQGVGYCCAAGNTQASLGYTCNNNTALALTNVSWCFILDKSWLNGSGTLQNNYVDEVGTGPAGSNTHWADWTSINNGGLGTGPYAGAITVSGNTSVRNGATLT